MMTAELNMTGRLSTVEAVMGYVLAGRATFTLRSVKTGARFTFKATKAEEVTDLTAPAYKRVPTWFVNLLTGPDNEADFQYLGIIKENGFGRFIGVSTAYTFRQTPKSPIGADAPSAVAFAWFFQRYFIDRKTSDWLEVWHEGRCGRCGRKLTVPESVERGIGPDCAEKGGYY